jgi:RNA polymerase sigma-70 factor (ECF subfamily)
MDSIPDTRASLIARIADARDFAAWEQFTRIYQPLVYRLARKRGLQHADAEELVQEAMLAVSRAVDAWVPDPRRGRFRDWLRKISRNLAINFLTRRKHQVWGTGDSAAQRLLEAQCDGGDDLARTFNIEYRREVFSAAAERVQRSVNARTWKAFWLTTLDDIPAGEAARQLGMSIGGVYIARSRVMARLREEVRRCEEAQESASTRV